MSQKGLHRGRARQACTPCRKKKTRCPGERPVCSLCSRLKQTCSYVRGVSDLVAQRTEVGTPRVSTESSILHDTDIRSSPNTPSDRLGMLETRFNRIEDALNVLLTRSSAVSSTGRLSAASPYLTVDGEAPEAQYRDNAMGRFDQLRMPTPPLSVLLTLVDIYQENIDSFMFCVLDADKIVAGLSSLQESLLWSFLGLTTRFSTHEFYEKVDGSVIDFYTGVARQRLFTELADPTWNISTLQALCLLCYSDVIDGKKPNALQTLGIAARYAITSKSRQMNEEYDRCIWSLWFIDLTYSSVMPALSDSNLPFDPPQCVAETGNPSLPDTGDESGLSPQAKDSGVGFHAAKLLRAWNGLFSYLQQARVGLQERAWIPKSEYRQVEYQMYEIELHFPEGHRFRLSRLDMRTSEEVQGNRRYWETWIVLQITYHTIRTVLNHPFIHLVQGPRIQKPPTFLQYVTDEAILHSRWVVRIVQLSQQNELGTVNPFLGHVVSMAATAHFFFCFAKEEAIATKALEGFQTCHGFVKSLAKKWKNLGFINSKLERLADYLNRPGTGNRSGTKIAETLLWELFDYAAASSDSEHSEAGNSVEVDLTTRHVSPLDPGPAQPDFGEFEAMLPDTGNQIVDGFSLDDFEMPDLSRFMFPGGDWNDGQL